MDVDGWTEHVDMSDSRGVQHIWGQIGNAWHPCAGKHSRGPRTGDELDDHNGNFWLYGGFGADSTGYSCELNDLWEFIPSSREWAWMGGSPFCLGMALG